jgi:hypothetical protein
MTDIPITANERKAQFTGNTGLGPFAFTFNILTSSDIRVIKNSTVLTLTSEYTVTTNVDGTGSVTLTGSGNGTALISSDILTIIGNRQLARTSDYVQGGNLFAEALNEDLDSIVIMMQQLDEKVSRTMRIDAGDIGENLLLPSKASRLNRVLQFNASTGDPEAGPTAADVANAQTNATNAANSASAASGFASAASGSASSASGFASAASSSADEAAAFAASINPASLLAVANNLSDVASAATARTNLGLEIGVDVQAYDATILVDADIGVNVQAYDATLLNGADIGVSVQAYDADTAKLDVAQSFTAAQRGSTDTDATNTGNVTLDFSVNQNFVLTLTGNVTLDNPTTEVVGQSGFIVFIQDGTGGRTVSLGTDYETAGGTGLTLSSAASATDVVPYIVAASGRILLGAPQLAFA